MFEHKVVHWCAWYQATLDHGSELAMLKASTVDAGYKSCGQKVIGACHVRTRRPAGGHQQ